MPRPRRWYRMDSRSDLAWIDVLKARTGKGSACPRGGPSMSRFVALLVGLCLSVPLFAGEVARTPPPEARDMIVLFNGRDLTGWDGDPRLWRVQDGVVHGE